MPQMTRNKDAQKILNKLIGKPDAFKRQKKTKADELLEKKAVINSYYQRSYAISR